MKRSRPTSTSTTRNRPSQNVQYCGVIAESVYQAKGDPNNVLVLHRFATMQAAETFFANPQLLDALRQAGVEGQPRIEFYEEAK